MSNVIRFPEPALCAERRKVYLACTLPFIAHAMQGGIDLDTIAKVTPTFEQFCARLDGQTVEEALGIEPEPPFTGIAG